MCFIHTLSTLSLFRYQYKNKRVYSMQTFKSIPLRLFFTTTMTQVPNPAKALLRDEIAAKISALSTEEKNRQSEIVFSKVINSPWYKSANRIAIFMSTDQEINIIPIIDHIQSRGASAYVPQYAGGKMKMLRLETGDPEIMPKTRHGILQHGKSQVRDDALQTGGLDLIITPGQAFTKAGARLGHGGGYYDKFFVEVKSFGFSPKVIAIGFDVQITDEIPMDEHDQWIDEVIYAD